MAFDRNAEEDLAYGHKPVLLDECLTGLNIRPDGIYVDGTLGRAGHSLEIARRLSGGGRLICLDRDETAIAAARERLADYRDRVTLVHSNFSRLGEVLGELGIPGADGVVDEGVVQFRLQMEVLREVEAQDEAHVVTGPDGAGREAGVADAGRDERVVGEVDAAAYADHQALGGGRAGEDERGEEGEDQVFHKTLMFRTGSHQG